MHPNDTYRWLKSAILKMLCCVLWTIILSFYPLNNDCLFSDKLMCRWCPLNRLLKFFLNGVSLSSSFINQTTMVVAFDNYRSRKNNMMADYKQTVERTPASIATLVLCHMGYNVSYQPWKSWDLLKTAFITSGHYSTSQMFPYNK